MYLWLFHFSRNGKREDDTTYAFILWQADSKMVVDFDGLYMGPESNDVPNFQ